MESREAVPKVLGEAITNPEYAVKRQNEVTVNAISMILDKDGSVVAQGHNHVLTRSKDFVVRNFGDKAFKVFVYKKEDTFQDPDIKRLNGTYYGVILEDYETGVSSDPDTIRIDAGKNLIFDNLDGTFVDNDINLVEFVGSVAAELLSNKQQRIDEQRAQQTRDKARRKAHLMYRVRNSLDRGLLGITPILGGIALIFGGIPYAIYRAQHGQYTRHVEAFDDKNLQLFDGNKLQIGDIDKSPFFSKLMATSSDLSLRNVPMVEAGGYMECTFGPQRCGTEPKENYVDFNFGKSALRTLVMYSTKADQNCRSVTFQKTPPERSNLEIWTDLGGVSNPARAQEIKVSYKKDGIVACWIGKKASDNEVARVIFRVNQ